MSAESDDRRSSRFSREGDDRAQIVVTTEMSDVVASAERALRDHPSVGVYQRGRLLVSVAKVNPKTLPKGLVRPAGSPFITPLASASLRECLSRAAEFLRADSSGQLVPCLPPSWVADVLRDKGVSELPHLTGLVEAPTLRSDGSVLQEPGYDEFSGLVYIPGEQKYPTVPADPGRDDARRALDILRAPFCDFPFLSPSDEAAVMAAILTIVARHVISGPVPLFAVRANAPGAGKGLIVASICTLTTGRPPALLAPACGSEEMRKLILTLAVEGVGPACFDNVVGAFGSPTIAAALTADVWTGRWLGVNKSVTAPLTWVPFVTGNNITFRFDCGRRVVPIDIQPEVEHPEDRTGFRYPELLKHLRRERPTLIAAALTILRAHACAGGITHGGTRMGSFENWDDVVRSALLWVGAADPCEGRTRVRADDDEDLEVLRAALHAWDEAFGSEPQTALQAVDAASHDAGLQVVLLALSPPKKGESLGSRALGNALRAQRNRVADGMKFDAHPTKHGGRTRWMVVRVGDHSHPRDGALGALGDVAADVQDDSPGSSSLNGQAIAPPSEFERRRGDHQVHQVHQRAPQPSNRGLDNDPRSARPRADALLGCPDCGETSPWRGAHVRACESCDAAYRALAGDQS